MRQVGKEKTVNVSTYPCLCAGVVSVRQAEKAGWEGDNCLCQSVSPHVHVFVQVVVSVRQAGKETTVLSNAAREATAPTAHKSASV